MLAQIPASIFSPQTRVLNCEVSKIGRVKEVVVAKLGYCEAAIAAHHGKGDF
jgi:hypothetical protein